METLDHSNSNFNQSILILVCDPMCPNLPLSTNDSIYDLTCCMEIVKYLGGVMCIKCTLDSRKYICVSQENTLKVRLRGWSRGKE